MHLQQAWFHEYFAHHAPISYILLVYPQKQVGHLPDGQLPPQLLAVTNPKPIIPKSNAFMFNFYYILLINPPNINVGKTKIYISLKLTNI